MAEIGWENMVSRTSMWEWRKVAGFSICFGGWVIGLDYRLEVGEGLASKKGMNEKITTTGFGLCNWEIHGAIYQFEEDGRGCWSRGEEPRAQALFWNVELEMSVKPPGSADELTLGSWSLDVGGEVGAEPWPPDPALYVLPRLQLLPEWFNLLSK